jgi:hypothetical protein
VPLAGAAAQHPGPPLPRQGPAVAARRPAAALDERASAALRAPTTGRAAARPGQHAAAPASSRSAQPGTKPPKGRFAAHHQPPAAAHLPARPYQPAGKELSPRYRNSDVARVPELDKPLVAPPVFKRIMRAFSQVSNGREPKICYADRGRLAFPVPGERPQFGIAALAASDVSTGGRRVQPVVSFGPGGRADHPVEGRRRWRRPRDFRLRLTADGMTADPWLDSGLGVG